MGNLPSLLIIYCDITKIIYSQNVKLFVTNLLTVIENLNLLSVLGLATDACVKANNSNQSFKNEPQTLIDAFSDYLQNVITFRIKVHFSYDK